MDNAPNSAPPVAGTLKQGCEPSSVSGDTTATARAKRDHDVISAPSNPATRTAGGTRKRQRQGPSGGRGGGEGCGSGGGGAGGGAGVSATAYEASSVATAVVVPSKEADADEVVRWLEDYAGANNNDAGFAAAATAAKGLTQYRLTGRILYDATVPDLKPLLPDVPTGALLFIRSDWRKAVDDAASQLESLLESQAKLPAEVLDWVKAVLGEDGSVVDEADPVVALPDNVAWPGMDEIGHTHANVLFRRSFYDPLLEKLLNGITPFEYRGRGLHRVILCGTPGIGKSALGVYAAAKVLRDGRPVVYASKKQELCFVAYPNGKVRHVETAFNDVFNPPDVHDELYGKTVGTKTLPTNAVLICDSLTPSTSIKAFTIVVTSPQQSVWSEYCKDGAVAFLFMPNYTLSELQGLRAAAFTGITSEEVVRRFGLYGGNPRLVLAWEETLVERAVATSLGDLRHNDVQTLGGLDTADSFYTLLRVTTKGENQELGLSTADAAFYDFAGVAPPTPYIADKLLAQAQWLDAALVGRLQKVGGVMAAVASMALQHRALKEVTRTLRPLNKHGARVTSIGSENKTGSCMVAGHDKGMCIPGHVSAQPASSVVEIDV